MPIELASTARDAASRVPDRQDVGFSPRPLHERVALSPAVITLLSAKGPALLDVPFYALQTEPWGRTSA